MVPQHTPRAVTSAPPLLVILPPETAVVAVIAETLVVDRTGFEGFLQECKIDIRPIQKRIVTVVFRRRFMAVIFRLKYHI
jgi:hypothetical protein